jgi:hypothetical protein
MVLTILLREDLSAFFLYHTPLGYSQVIVGYERPEISMIFTVILVRRARSWNVVGDLRSTGMCPG